MTHDPLCHEARCDADRCAISDLLRCQCAIIAKARADEREQAAQRVATFMDSDPVERETWDEFLSALIAAARGEEP